VVPRGQVEGNTCAILACDGAASTISAKSVNKLTIKRGNSYPSTITSIDGAAHTIAQSSR
jgi:hypothetical protein